MTNTGNPPYLSTKEERKKRRVKFSENPIRGRLSFIMGIMLGMVIGIIMAGVIQ